ncbi:MAG TPA: hypothetical protein PK497_13580 [Burkholderiaceae bacterium]|nr:hypothetical protein [Burkholderiaceae bacterium]
MNQFPRKTFVAFAISGIAAMISASASSQTVTVAASTTTPTTTTTTVPATTPLAEPARKLASQYSEFAGSQKNAEQLITGLRNDTPVTLVAGTGSGSAATSATFTPATGKMGYGNVNIALALAREDLAKLGITNPTPEQLAAALNGGDVKTATGTVTMAGVLAQRQSGMGWGKIANGMGVKLGSLASASKTGKTTGKTLQVAAADTTGKAHGSGKSGESHGGGNAGGNGGGNGGGKK